MYQLLLFTSFYGIPNESVTWWPVLEWVCKVLV